MIATAYDADTEVRRRAPGRYDTTVSDRWNALGGMPNGGYALGLCVRALAAEVDHPDPLVVSATFLRRLAPGAAEIEVDPLRAGRRLSTASARLVQGGREALRATATFADITRPGRRALALEPPRLPEADACVDLREAGTLPGVTIADRVEYRMPELPGWLRGEPSGRAEAAFWMRFADGRRPDALALPMLVDAAAPAIVELGVGSVTVELTVHVRDRPATDWLACRAATRVVSGGFHEEDVELWDAAGRLVAQSRQLAVVVG
jgi:acyl-CoA thioesterase